MCWSITAAVVTHFAAEYERRRYGQARQDMAPWLEAGRSALAQMDGWYRNRQRGQSIAELVAEHRRKIAAMERETTRWNWALMVGATALVVWTALMALGVV